MAKKLTEDAVRDKARDILGFKDKDGVRSGVGQITTFNQLGFPGVSDKPDGWYLPDNHADTAIVLETKASYIACVINEADEWRGRNVWYPGRSVRYAPKGVTTV